MVKFQHPVSGTYKKYTNDHGQNYFACASGGGIGRTLNVDDIAAGPASYGFTDMLSRIYADATFAGSSSVPAHVEMMGFIGMGWLKRFWPDAPVRRAYPQVTLSPQRWTAP